MKNTTLVLRIFLLAAFLLIAIDSKAQSAGSLDATFGTGGKVGTHLTVMAQFRDTVIQPDGKIIVVGVTYGQSPQVQTAFVARFNSDGTLDMTFDTDGYNNSFFMKDATTVALQPDGKTVVGGIANGFGNKFGVARFNSDGSLDTTFNGSGMVSTEVGSSSIISSINVQADGKIVAAATTILIPFSGDSDFALVRYNADGSLDATFGTGGRVATNIGGADMVYDSVIQPDGKIIAVGYSTDILSNLKAATIVRYNTDGSLDTAFGTGGKVIKSGTANSIANEVVIQPDGKIVILGEGTTPLRYNSNGTLETTFQSGGNNFIALSAAIQPNGKIVVAGVELMTNNPSAFAVVRYNSDGSLDTAFGTGGKVITSSSNTAAVAVAIQPDGNIVAGGTDTDNSQFQILLARYFGDPLPKPKTRKRIRFF